MTISPADLAAQPPVPATTAPWLSVLVPVYNVQAFLEECVRSVVEQADAGVEVLLLDDVSTDGSDALAAALMARWPQHVRVLRHTRNRGLSAARNSLLTAAQGRYIWFLDSDDKLLPGAIAGLRRLVDQHQPDLVTCDFAVWREAPRLKHRLRGEAHRRSLPVTDGRVHTDSLALLANLLHHGQLHAWSKIGLRALWGEDLRFPEGRYFEDLATMPQLALRARRHVHASAPWVAYRQRGGSILATMTPRKALDQSAGLRPLRAALNTGRPSTGHAALDFALAHQSARNLRGAARALLSADLPDAERLAALAQVRDDFRAISPLDAAALQRAYLRRGWWWKTLQWARLARAVGLSG